MQAFLEYVVSGLVNHPEAVSVTPVEQGGTTLYELRLNPEDVGKVIGRNGRTAQALRRVMNGVGGPGLRVDVIDTDRDR